jgi:tetratricopeptide (TPR) repeat protein
MEILLAAMLFAGSYNIQGTVALESGAGIDSPVLVQLLQGANVPIDCVYTALTGSFTFQDVAAGSYYVRVQHEGYEDALQRIEVPAVGEIPAIVLRRQPEALPDTEPQLGGRYKVTVRQLATPPDAVRDYAKALADFDKGEADRGIHHLQRAIEIAPDFLEAINRLFDEFYKSQRYADAEQVLVQAISAVPNEIQLRFLLAMVFVREHRYKDALPQIDYSLQNGGSEIDRAKLERFRSKLNRHATADAATTR